MITLRKRRNKLEQIDSTLVRLMNQRRRLIFRTGFGLRVPMPDLDGDQHHKHVGKEMLRLDGRWTRFAACISARIRV